jgi:hypothetical protein
LSGVAGEVKGFEAGEEIVVNEVQKVVTGGGLLAESFFVGPGFPTKVFRGWGFVRGVGEFCFKFEVAVDLEEEKPRELFKALCVAADACVLSHGVA